MFLIFPIMYILVNNEYVAKYEGQSEETITSMITSEGKTVEFITKKEYEDFLEAHKLSPRLSNPEREQAILDATDSRKSTEERLEAVIKYLGL